MVTRLERSCAGPDRADWIAMAPERATRCGVQRIEARFAGHAYEPHRHDTYSFGITLSGVQSFDYRGARRDSIPGRAMVLHPDELHDGRAGTDEGFRYRMLYVEPRLVRAALDGRASSLPFIDGAVSNDPVLVGRVRAALWDLSRALEPLELDQTLLDLSEALLRLDPDAQTGQGSGSQSLTSKRAVDTARELLHARATQQVESIELEEATGMQRHELCRQFRRHLGTSPHRYLTMRRLVLARELIEAGDSLAGAAEACRFADQSHMTRAFGRAYGMAPGRWRRLSGTVPGSADRSLR